jgi:hypothetical protein
LRALSPFRTITSSVVQSSTFTVDDEPEEVDGGNTGPGGSDGDNNPAPDGTTNDPGGGSNYEPEIGGLY